MIDYGIKITVNGDAPEKLRKIAEASKWWKPLLKPQE